MSGKFEVLLTNDASGQMWNTCLWDPNTGSTLGTFKVRIWKQSLEHFFQEKIIGNLVFQHVKGVR